MALVALAAPASATISPGPPQIDVTVSGHFRDTLHTELVMLDLSGAFSGRGRIPAGPIQDTVHLPIITDVFFDITWMESAGTLCHEAGHELGTCHDSGSFQIDSFFDVFVDVGTRTDPETGKPTFVSTMAYRYQAGTVAHELGHNLSLRLGAGAEASAASMVDPGTGATTTRASGMVDSFFDVFTVASPNAPGMDLATASFRHGYTSVLRDPGPVQSPSLQAESFFDVFVAAAMLPAPPDGGVNVASPGAGVETHARGVDATSSFDVFGQVVVSQWQGPSPPVDLQVGLSDGDALFAVWEANGMIDFDCDAQINGSARFRTLHENLDLAVVHGARYQGEGQPGAVSLPGDSFFDIFQELEIPSAGDTGSIPDVFQARVEQPSRASGLAEITGDDFILSLGSQDTYCINC